MVERVSLPVLYWQQDMLIYRLRNVAIIRGYIYQFEVHVEEYCSIDAPGSGEG